MSEQTEHLKKRFLEALEKSMGIVTPACKAAGIGRTTYYLWRNSDEAFKEAADDVKNVQIDFVESKLLKRIQADSDTAIIFYLKTQAKDRGYNERIEGNIRIEGEFDWSKVPLEKRIEILKIMDAAEG
jgi:hypothetical protein